MIPDVVRRLFNRISRLEHVSAKIIRIGNVVEVDNESDRVKVKVGDGDPIDARWSSLASGAIKIRVTPSVGQVVTLICPNGDARQAFAQPGDWSGKNPSPSSEADEILIGIGAVGLQMTAEKFFAKAGGTSLSITEAGITTKGNVDHNDGYVKNDGHAIDQTHKHTDVVSGGDLTGVPQ